MKVVIFCCLQLISFYQMKSKYFILFFLLPVSFFGFSQSSSNHVFNKNQSRMEWWEDARFGMFIHWGIYSLYGGKYNGYEQVDPGAEWIMNRCKIPVLEYRTTANEFNPTKYNPEQWVKMARDAGMRYIVITAKHHDGFALFDSKVSDWDIVDATPYGKDLLGPLAEACNKYGVNFGIYYSQNQDWVHPGGNAYRRLTNSGWPNPDSTMIDKYTEEHNGHWDPIQESKSFNHYIDHIAVPQVREILSNYNNISILWWDTPNGMTDGAASKLQDELKNYPSIITNDRLKSPNFKGDFTTREQRAPNQEKLFFNNWEICMTMNTSWGYRQDNQWKSANDIIRTLVDVASKGGNLLLNVGPKPDGTFPEESILILNEIGEWMDVNGEAIYGTSSCPINGLSWGRCTQKKLETGTILYLSIFEWPKESNLTIQGIGSQVFSASLLSTSERLKISSKGNDLTVELPKVIPDNSVNVVRIDLVGQIKEL
ncbi:MAG: alpha-L-fucosidase [Draconibacterium sp.]